MTESRYSIGSLEAALDVLETFLNGRRHPRGVTEISRITGLNKTRVFRILATLESRGYVRQNPETQEYTIGPGFLFLGDIARDTYDLRDLAIDVLEDLAEASGDSANLFVLSGRSAVCIAIARGRHILQAAGHIGEKLPLYASASPKLLLAYLPRQHQKRIISGIRFVEYTEKTVKSVEELQRQLDAIIEKGYSESTDDYEIGMYVVAAPVRDHTGQVIASISLAVPQVRDSEERREKSREMIIEAASRISKKMGFTESSPDSNPTE